MGRRTPLPRGGMKCNTSRQRSETVGWNWRNWWIGRRERALKFDRLFARSVLTEVFMDTYCETESFSWGKR